MIHRITRLIKTEFFGLVAISATTFASIIPGFNIPVDASDNAFKCVQREGYAPVTKVIARNQKTEKDFIIYTDPFFSRSGYTPPHRCELITARLNAAIASAQTRGKISTIVITNRVLNGYEVICIADDRKSECRHLILTLRTGKDAVAAGERIMKSLRNTNSSETYQEGPSIAVRLYPLLSK
jgi:Circadian oscillating protein COP23